MALTPHPAWLAALLLLASGPVAPQTGPQLVSDQPAPSVPMVLLKNTAEDASDRLPALASEQDLEPLRRAMVIRPQAIDDRDPADLPPLASQSPAP